MNMGVFNDHKREIICIYNSTNYTDKQTLAYLQATKKSLLPIDISKEQITGTQWVEISKRLHTNLKQLVDTSKVDNTVSIDGQQDCITLLNKQPNALNGAVVLTKNKIKQIKNPSDVLAFLDVDSAGISKPY